MKTILHISKYYSPYHGGIESVAKQIVDALVDYTNIVICFSQDNKNHVDTVDGVTVYRIGVQHSYKSQDISFTYAYTLHKLIKTYKPDLIHLHCPNPFVYPIVKWLKPHRTKLVVHWHSDILGKGKAYEWVKGIENRILAKADRIIATSPNYIYDSIPMQPYADKVVVIPNGIETHLLDKQAGDDEAIAHIREKWGNKKIILFLGRHIYYKGLNMLIEAEALVQHDVQILIAGDGPLHEEYQELAKGKNRISFLGRISQDERRQYLWAADIFAFPSINKAEAFGVALAEAMYCEAVPVVFHIPGSGVNWVNKKNVTGMEVPLKDVAAYAEAIDQLLDKPKKTAMMGKAAHNYVAAKFSQEMVDKGIHKLYQQLLDK